MSEIQGEYDHRFSNDLDRQLTFPYVMNKMGISSPGGLSAERTKAYTKTAFSCAGA